MELSLHPEKQERLRQELSEFANTDPTYDQFTNGLPFLDAVTREVLRLHPPLTQTIRIVCISFTSWLFMFLLKKKL